MVQTYSGLAKEPVVVTDPVGLPLEKTFNGNSSAPVNAGSYAVVATVADPNYLGSVSGTFTISQAGATVSAQDKITRQGYPAPPFTSSFAGFVNGENQSVVTSLLYTVSPVYSGAPGIYQIVPAATAANYLFTPVNGNLYVNPFGQGAKNVKVSLTCVEHTTPDPNGFAYIARFKYINANTTPVYVPAGIENRLTGPGHFSSSGQPQLFNPGEGTWEVRFNGGSITWTVKSYNNWTKTTSAASATSSSLQCSKNMLAGDIQDNQGEKNDNLKVYPNPSDGKVFIELNGLMLSPEDISLYDMQGNLCRATLSGMSDFLVELDLAGFKPGMYMLRIRTGEGFRVFRIVRL